jgi:hypothetical protein
MSSQSYLVHEKAYQELQRSSFQGWGGETYDAMTCSQVLIQILRDIFKINCSFIRC